MLEAADLSVFYGRHRALEKVTVRVDRGEICVILGANGAGKSTLLKAIAGLVPSEAGSRISVNGTAIRAMKPSRIVERGIALVPETSAIFGELTVGENLQLGAYPTRARRSEAANLKRVYELFPVLAARRSQVARTMSGGEQKMLAIGRALMSEPDILMLDEPSLGLSPILTSELFKALGAIGKAGVGILLVEQNAKQSLKIADRGYLLENGHIVGEESAVALASDPAVRRAYLGDTGAEPPPQTREVTEQSASLVGPSATEIGSRASELAARAASIHAAYVQSTRTSTEPRSAPTAPAPSTETPAMPASSAPSDLTRMAAALAERAVAVEAAYAASLRRQSPANGAASPTPPSKQNGGTQRAMALPEPTDASALTRMAEEMARRAAQQHPRSTGRETPILAPTARNGAEATDAAHALSRIAGELAARAAALDARFLAEHRSVAPLTHLASSDTEDAATAQPKKKHKHGKKKCRKSRKRGGKDKGD